MTLSREDLVRLADFLHGKGIAVTRPLSARPIGDGHSNLTYRIDGAEQPLVLRRPPPPPLPPGSNDMRREAQVIAALAGIGPPTPAWLATAQTGELFDVPCYVMAMVDGMVFTDRIPQRLSRPGAVAAIANALVDSIAQLHAVDYVAAGLADFGRPEGFNARHLRRIATLVTDEERAALPLFASLEAWLAEQCPPESGCAIIHNDLRLGNVMWRDADEPEIVAVLDWELATLGDPLMDLGYLLASLPRDGACRTPVQQFASALLSGGCPVASTLADRYAQHRGIDLPALDWYLAVVNWKLAALYAYSRRKGADPYFADAQQVPQFLVEAAFHAGLT